MSTSKQGSSKLSLQRQLSEKETKIESLEIELEKIKKEHTHEMQKLKDELIQKFDKIIQSIQKENETYKAQKEELSDKLKIVKMKKKLLKADCQRLKNDYDELYSKFTSMIETKHEDKFDEETKALINQLKEKIATQESSLNEIINENKYINDENKKMKSITRSIIEQRNETEIFFIEALDEVKRELFIKKKEMANRGNFFPTLKKNYEKQQVKVDIKSLSPEMKEKILRKLFTKINESYNPAKYKELNDIMAADISNDTEI